MSYLVLARKYRPQTFAGVVGQQGVAETLKNACLAGRVAHAYLFSGPRGVGKTSLARILAKALNCQNLQDGEPCNACPICEEITEGNALDIIEIDGASNRGVDEISDLLEGVGQQAFRCDIKVYIVDEVHMLTTHAFNALLKTLEEPPPHVKFVFATTDPQKVPETIVSRCQHFEFRRIGRGDIVHHLRRIADEEGIQVSDKALHLVARKAHGGLRDALSIFDGLVALCGETIDDDRLTEGLGICDQNLIVDVLEAIRDREPSRALEVVEQVYRGGWDPEELVEEVIEALRAHALFALCGPGSATAESTPWTPDDLAPLDGVLGVDEAYAAIDLLAQMQARMNRLREERVLLEMALVRLTRIPILQDIPEVLSRLEALEARLKEGGLPAPSSRPSPAVEGTAPARPEEKQRTKKAGAPEKKQKKKTPKKSGPPPREGSGSSKPKQPAPTATAEATTEVPADLNAIRDAWPAIVAQAREQNMGIGSALDAGSPTQLSGSRLVVHFPSTFICDRFSQPENRALAEAAIEEVCSARVRLKAELSPDSQQQKRSRSEILQEESVKNVQNLFEGSVVDVERDEDGD